MNEMTQRDDPEEDRDQLLAAIERAGFQINQLPNGKYWLAKIRECRPVIEGDDAKAAEEIFNQLRDDIRKQNQSGNC